MQDKKEKVLISSVFAIIILLAALFRLYGVWWGLPLIYHCDEWGIVGRAMNIYWTNSFTLNFFPQPAFTTYFLFFVLDFLSNFVKIDMAMAYLTARTINAVFAIATVALAYKIGKKAYDTKTGLLAAALLAFTVLHIRDAHFYWTDIIMTFWVTACAYFSLCLLQEGKGRYYLLAGMCAGFAAASKYGGALVVVLILAAHLLRGFERWKFNSKKLVNSATSLFSLIFINKYIYPAVIISAIVFFALNPSILSNYNGFKESIDYEFKHVSGVIRPEWTKYFINTPPYLYHIENVLFWGMGPLLEVVCIIGVGYALAKHRKEDLLLLAWVLPYFIDAGSWYVKFARYMIPLLPFLAILGARFMTAFYASSKNIYGSGFHTLSKVLIAIVLLSSLLYSIAYMNIYLNKDARTQATEWIMANAEDGSTIMLEPSPWERPQIRYYLSVSPVTEYDRNDLKVIELDIWKVRDPNIAESTRQSVLNNSLSKADYIVMSERFYDNVVTDPEASQTAKQYYADLFSGKLGFKLVRDIKVNPSVLGFEFNDDKAEMNFRIFDHPHVWIFKKEGEKQNAS